MRYPYQFGQAHCQISVGVLLSDLMEYHAAVVRVDGRNKVICFRYPWRASGPLCAITPGMCPPQLREHVAIASWPFAEEGETVKILRGEIPTYREPSLGLPEKSQPEFF